MRKERCRQCKDFLGMTWDRERWEYIWYCDHCKNTGYEPDAVNDEEAA
jgi:ribosomal protein L37AE/L43A